jgi:hypothetical protein
MVHLLLGSVIRHKYKRSKYFLPVYGAHYIGIEAWLFILIFVVLTILVNLLYTSLEHFVMLPV